MKTAFITGANKGIGFEIAKQLLQKGFYVYLGSRNLENGIKALQKLKAENLTSAAVCPGYTKTDFTGYNGGEVEEAGKRIVKYALLDKDGVTGKFISEETNPTTGEIPLATKSNNELTRKTHHNKVLAKAGLKYKTSAFVLSIKLLYIYRVEVLLFPCLRQYPNRCGQLGLLVDRLDQAEKKE